MRESNDGDSVERDDRLQLRLSRATVEALLGTTVSWVHSPFRAEVERECERALGPKRPGNALIAMLHNQGYRAEAEWIVKAIEAEEERSG